MTLQPGHTLGILGGGQLGRMMALEAKRLGYRIACLDPDPNGPCAQVADLCIHGSFDNIESALKLATQADLLTVETEHISALVLEAVEKKRPLFPGCAEMKTIQDRLLQKIFLQKNKIPQTSFAEISSLKDLQRASETIGFPCVLKTRKEGYDGRGQVRLNSKLELESGWERLKGKPCVLEGYVEFKKEISVVLARSRNGDIAVYPIAENVHRKHILHLTLMPGRLPTSAARVATQLAKKIANQLDHVGVMAVEFFWLGGNRLWVNEIAPRPHNSGHPTFGGAITSQFEQHIRAVCGLKLGLPTISGATAMLNLLGDLWSRGEPDWNHVLRHPAATLHLYGKLDARTGRKMGHVLIREKNPARALALATRISKDLEA